MPAKTHSPPSVPPVGQNIRKARESIPLRQLDLAHAIGLKGPDAGANISRIESGQHVPHLETIARIAGALKVELDVLLAG